MQAVAWPGLNVKNYRLLFKGTYDIDKLTYQRGSDDRLQSLSSPKRHGQ